VCFFISRGFFVHKKNYTAQNERYMSCIEAEKEQGWQWARQDHHQSAWRAGKE